MLSLSMVLFVEYLYKAKNNLDLINENLKTFSYLIFKTISFHVSH